MKILIKTRHLAPIYGNKTPIAPEVKDYLTINSVPDIFHMGHVHVIGCENYRGTFLINSGAWQGQTAFQRKMGLVPQPGIVPVINLKTLHLTTIDFNL
jgi:DNA polymerase II small subunit